MLAVSVLLALMIHPIIVIRLGRRVGKWSMPRWYVFNGPNNT